MGWGATYVTYVRRIVAATLKRSQVLGEFALGNDMHGKEVDMVDVLDGMSVWWEKRTLQTRLDCQMAQKNNLPGALDCAAAPPGKYDYPFCYITDDGWDAMEGAQRACTYSPAPPPLGLLHARSPFCHQRPCLFGSALYKKQRTCPARFDRLFLGLFFVSFLSFPSPSSKSYQDQSAATVAGRQQAP